MLDVLFWWAIYYCLLLILYTLYSIIYLIRTYRIKSRENKVRFVPSIAFKRLIENYAFLGILYLLLSVVVGIFWLMYKVISI